MKKIITIIILTVLFNNLSAQVIFYTNCDFLGQMLLFEEGNYPFEKISKYNDIFSSVRVYNNNSGVNPYNYEVTVFENGDFTGKQLKLNGSVSCFESYNFGANDTWNDKISSFKIEKIYKVEKNGNIKNAFEAKSFNFMLDFDLNDFEESKITSLLNRAKNEYDNNINSNLIRFSFWDGGKFKLDNISGEKIPWTDSEGDGRYGFQVEKIDFLSYSNNETRIKNIVKENNHIYCEINVKAFLKKDISLLLFDADATEINKCVKQKLDPNIYEQYSIAHTDNNNATGSILGFHYSYTYNQKILKKFRIDNYFPCLYRNDKYVGVNNYHFLPQTYAVSKRGYLMLSYKYIYNTKGKSIH